MSAEWKNHQWVSVYFSIIMRNKWEEHNGKINNNKLKNNKVKIIK